MPAAAEDPAGTASSRGPVRSSGRRWEPWAAALLGLYFVARLLYFALNIAPGIPPDETTHAGLIRLYAEVPWGIHDSPASYPYGLVTRVPYLYHLLLGKLAALNVFGLDPLLALRWINAALAALTLGLAWRLVVRLTGDAAVRLLFLVMASNTLMVTFLGAAVSYDNLVHLLAVAALGALVRFLERPRPQALLELALWNALGALTKITFLPLSAILALIVLYDRRRHLAADLRALAACLRPRRPRAVLLALVTVVAAGAGLELYGGNLLRYGKPVPACDQVLPLQACLENRIFARDWVVGQYRQGAISFQQAVAAAQGIGHPGDRDHALRLLRNEQAHRLSQPEPLPVWDYLFVVWDQALRPTLFGIQAHASMLKDRKSLAPYSILLLAAFLLWVRHGRWSGPERLWSYLATIALAYFTVLVGLVNYRTYLETHAPFLGVQGRYLLPVLVPAYLVAARYLMEPFGRALRIALLVVAGGLFIWGDLPYFLRHATPAWFASPPSQSRLLLPRPGAAAPWARDRQPSYTAGAQTDRGARGA